MPGSKYPSLSHRRLPAGPQSEVSVTAEINEEQDIRTNDDVVVIGLDVRDYERDLSLRQGKVVCERLS
jgi:hypothetical protein